MKALLLLFCYFHLISHSLKPVHASELPQVDDATGPEFSEAYYTAAYPVDGIGDFEFKPSLEFANIEDINDIVISLDRYTDNFEIIRYDGDKWLIKIIKPLDDYTVDVNSDLVMTLTATEIGKEVVGKAVLVLELPKSDCAAGPKFSEIYYIVDYPEDDTGTIEFKPSLEFSNVNNIDDIVITLDKYSANFEIKYESNEWYINILTSLDDDTLAQNSELIITLTASTSDNSDTSEAVLLMNLPHNPEEEAPEFSKAYYIAKYPKEGSGTLDFDGPLEFTNVKDATSVAITLSNYADFFEIKYSDKWYISVLLPLEDAVLQENAELVLTLIAKEGGSEKTGKAALVLKLPMTDELRGPKFEDALYVATYPQSGLGLIAFEPAISFSNNADPTQLNIQLKTYTENFEMVWDSEWYLHISKSLEDSVLYENQQLLTTIIVQDIDGNEGKSGLVVQLPTPENGRTLRFSEPYYLAGYPKDGRSDIEFDTPLEFLNMEEGSSLVIQLDNYTENFAFKYESRKWSMEITHSLDEAVLQENTELVMALIAVESGNSYKAKSALILKLPSETGEATTIFSEGY